MGIPDYNLENVHDVDVIDYGVHNRSIRGQVVRTCAVDRHNHGDEDRAEEVGAFPGASEVAYHHACAFRDACDHMDLRLVPSSHHHRHRPRLFQLDSFHYVYLLPFRNTASLQQKVAAISMQRCALVPTHREKKFPFLANFLTFHAVPTRRATEPRSEGTPISDCFKRNTCAEKNILYPVLFLFRFACLSGG